MEHQNLIRHTKENGFSYALFMLNHCPYWDLCQIKEKRERESHKLSLILKKNSRFIITTGIITISMVFRTEFKSSLFAQSQFQITYGGTSSDRASSICKTNNGGYVIAGNTNSFGAGSSDIFVMKTDSAGTMLWSQTYGGTLNDLGYCIIPTTDGGYAVTGNTASFSPNYDAYVIKIDALGNLQWTKTIGGAGSDNARSIVQTTDGGYALAGDSPQGGQGATNVYIVKLDAGGNLQWTRSVGGTANDYGYSIIQSSDGGFAVAGVTYSYGASPGNTRDAYIIKLDVSGNLQWTRTVGGAGDEFGESIAQTNDGGYIMGGTTVSYGALAGGVYTDLYAVKLSSSGAVQWTKTVGGTWNDYAYSAMQTADGGYVFAGGTENYGTNPNFNNPNAYIVKLNSSGTLQWTGVAGGGNWDVASSIVEQSDGSFVLAGSSLAGSWNIYLVKFDSSGNTCNGTSGGLTSSGGISGSGGIAGSGGAVGSGGVAGTPSFLQTNICSSGAAVSVTTIGSTICSGSCATLTASVSGGTLPYTYSWNPSGQTTSSIIVCPSSNTNYSVTVTDANTTTSNDTAIVTVQNCSSNCPAFQNPSFEGGSTGAFSVPPPWTICSGSPDLYPSSGGSPCPQTFGPSNGSQYEGSVAAGSGAYESFSQALSVPLTANTPYQFTIDLAGNNNCASLPIGVLKLYGSNLNCGQSQLLWTSPTITNFTAWQTYTVSFTPPANYTHITFVPDCPTCSFGQNAYIYYDNIACVASSPTVTATGNSICSGSCATISSSVSGGVSPFTYSWNPTGQTTQSIIDCPTSTTTYTVTVTDANGNTSTDTMIVSVTPTPTVSISGNTTICSGDAATLTASGGNNYSWNNSTTINPIVVSPTTNSSYTVIAFNGTCSDTDSVTVNVVITPTCSVTPPVSICAGNSATLCASGGCTYLWNSGSTASCITMSVSGTFTVIAQCGSCSDTAVSSISFYPNPAASINGNTSLCSGDATTLTASGGTSYSWWNNNSTSSSIVISPSTTTNYSVTVTDANGCTNDTSITVSVNPPPVASASSATICNGDIATLTASGGGNYLWSTTETTSSINVSSAGTYSVIVSVGNCSDTASGTVIVNPNPTASVSANTTITTGQSVTLVASGGGTYSWSNGDVGATIIISPNTTTYYCVTVTNANLCTDTACATVTVEPIDCSGEIFLPNAFSPNNDGMNDYLRIRYPDIACIKKLHIAIYDRWGEKVFESDKINFKWDGTYNGKAVNTSVLVYHMTVTKANNEIEIRKGNISLIR